MNLNILNSCSINCLFMSADPVWKQCTVFDKYVYLVALSVQDQVILTFRQLYSWPRCCVQPANLSKSDVA